MNKKIAICPSCHTKIEINGKSGNSIQVKCPKCGKLGSVSFKDDLEQLDFYPLNEPYAYAKVLKNNDTLEKFYKIIEPTLSSEEQMKLNIVWDNLIKTFNFMPNELDKTNIENYLVEQIEQVIDNYEINIDNITKKKIFYYARRETLGYGKIDPFMIDPNIEDISCDGTGVPIFLFHRKYGSLKSNIVFHDKDELFDFVVSLSQKCGKHISIAEPMLDATMPDGSRIQMTLGTQITTKGSTFTIRKFRADPFTPPDLIALNTVSAEIMAFLWLAVENNLNGLIAGGTASGKTTILNALSLFIPRDAKIVSIEETREINLPHPNWIPGISRSGFGQVVADKVVGEIDTYDLMKAALRQRPEYIIVGEIRGREAYVLFQAMATGHATYSTVHADSANSLIHRLEGKPIEIPRVMLQALDFISIHFSTNINGKRVRRCKQIVEIIDIDPTTKEILTNEVFKWNPIEDKFKYTGKSYILEKIRTKLDMTKEEITQEMKQRTEILKWMQKNNLRTFKEVAKVISRYKENSDDFLKKIKEKINDNKFSIFEENKKIFRVNKIEKPSDNNQSYIDPFKRISIINKNLAKILFFNKIKSIEDLKNSSIKDLTKIKGINKQIAKKIVKEVNKLPN